MNQIGAQRPEAPLFLKIELLAVQRLPATGAQLPAPNGGNRGMGIGVRRPGDPAPVRQIQGRLNAESLKGTFDRLGQAVDDAGADIQRQQSQGHQKPGTEIDVGKAAPPEQFAPALAVKPEVQIKGLALRHHGPDDRHRGENQQDKDGQADGR